MLGERHREAGNAAEVAERRIGIHAPKLAEPSVDVIRRVHGDEVERAETMGGLGRDRGKQDVPLLEEVGENSRGGVEDALHLLAGRIGFVDALLPYLHVHRLDQRRIRSVVSAQAGEAVDIGGDVGDVAFGLGGIGGAEIHCGGSPVDMMAEGGEELSGLLQLGDNVRRRTVVAPVMRKGDAERFWIAGNHGAAGFGLGPERHELAGGRTTAGIHEGRGVADGAAVAALDGDDGHEVGAIGGGGEDAARRLEAYVAADAGGDADRAAAVAGMGQRQHAAGDADRGAGRGATGGICGIPRIAGGVDVGILRGAANAEFRRCGAAHDIEAGSAELLHQETVGGGDVAAHQAGAHLLAAAFQGRAEILHQIRHAGKGARGVHAILQRIGNNIVEYLDDSGGKWVDFGDARDRLSSELRGRDLASADQSGETKGIVADPLIPAHYSRHAGILPTVRQSLREVGWGREAGDLHQLIARCRQ